MSDHNTPANLQLITGERHSVGRRMQQLIIEHALRGPVRILIGGNRFDAYSIAYALAAQVGNRFYEILEKHITLSRAEICPQMVELLTQTEANSTPTLVSDLLAPFYDEGFPDNEVDQHFFESMRELRRISKHAPVIISAYPKPARIRLFYALERAASQQQRLTPPNSPPRAQERLV